MPLDVEQLLQRLESGGFEKEASTLHVLFSSAAAAARSRPASQRAPSPPTTARVRRRRINATARPNIRYNPHHGVPVDASYETLDLLFSAVDERARLRAVGDEEGARQGDEEGPRQGDEEGTRQGDEEGTRQGDEEGARQGDEEGTRQGDEEGRSWAASRQSPDNAPRR